VLGRLAQGRQLACHLHRLPGRAHYSPNMILSKWSMKLRLIHEQNAVRQVRVWETEVDHTLKQFINLAKEFHFPIDAIDHLESATCCAVQFNLKTQGLLSPRSLP
jgi:hypothetical protein